MTFKTGPQKKVLVGTKGMSKPAQVAFAKAVSAGVDHEIDRMTCEDSWLPDLWRDLEWALDELSRAQFGDTLNQRMLRRDRIERIESMCHVIGAGGTYFAVKPVNH